MSEEGREEKSVPERIADALEKMAADPIIEYESGPPMCPGCGKYDPVIAMSGSDSMQGPLSEVVIQGQCTHCGNGLFAVVESYSMHRERDSAMAEMIERKERAGNENGN